MKKILILFCGLSLVMCKSPKVVFNDDLCTPKSDYHKNQFLESIDAKDKIYSILIFTSGFDNKTILITNKEEALYDGIINSDKSMGLAKILKINNNYDIVVKEIEPNYTFVLKQKDLEKHKYIYIEKDRFKKNRQYIVTYSNTLCGFK